MFERRRNSLAIAFRRLSRSFSGTVWEELVPAEERIVELIHQIAKAGKGGERFPLAGSVW